ncbi:MAG TPA: sigma-70 family RNA polymerase sigma factor [Isosphaeraceae bacterium]|jgi:RNA polymerase sigma-70 factor (ECF subfamily)|nr:sigma-70 family RNA polymerase sigma factor [Isosphaeraceae bacterium]
MSIDEAADPEGWVDRHGDGLYRYALLRLRAPDLAADVVQDTFLEALRSRDSFAGRSSERTWLIGILRHKIVDHFRKSGRQPATSNGVSLGGTDDLAFDARGHWRIGPAMWAGDPSREMETREFWEVFGRCLSRLPRGLADAFFLREVDGLGAEDVQQILGITPANFWKRLHRARLSLRQCLESGWFGQRMRPPPLPVKGRSRA